MKGEARCQVPPWKAAFDDVLNALRTACVAHYGDRLVSVIVFGSVGRGTMRPDSDIDLLVVADPLPSGRMRRVADFEPVEQVVEAVIQDGRSRGLATRLSPLFKTPGEVERGSPVFLDMTQDARILYDKNGFFGARMGALDARLKKLGAKRVFQGRAWWWDLKPDFKPGDTVTI
jgi:predicted nucleotidyltransferase